MNSFLTDISIGSTVFASTNIDDLFLLVAYFANPLVRHRAIVAAQRHASVYSTRNDIYDFNQGSVFVEADCTLSGYAILSASYTWADGYTVSSALVPNPGLGSIARAPTLDHAVPVPVGRK